MGNCAKDRKCALCTVAQFGHGGHVATCRMSCGQVKVNNDGHGNSNLFLILMHGSSLLLHLFLLLFSRQRCCVAHESILLNLNFHVDHQPTTIQTTVAVFRGQFGPSSIGVQSVLHQNIVHPLPWSTPTKILRSSFGDRPGLAGMLSMTCGSHSSPSTHPSTTTTTPTSTISSSSSITYINHPDQCTQQHTQRNWNHPPEGLMVLPWHACSATAGGNTTQDVLSKAIQIALGTDNGYNEIVVAFVLTWETSNQEVQGLLEHEIVQGKTSLSRNRWMKEVLTMLSTTCVLTQVPIQDQTIFPPGQLVWYPKTTRPPPTNNEMEPPLTQPIQQWTPVLEPSFKTQTFVILPEQVVPTSSTSGFSTNSSTAGSSSSSVLPPLPNYCPPEGQTMHPPHIQKALQAYHESSFIEEHAKMTEFPIPFVDTVLEFIMKLVLPAILNPFSEYYVKEVASRVSDEMGHKIVAEVPVDVVKLLTPPLTYNISNLLTDALTASVSKSLITSLTMEFGAPISLALSSNLMKSLYDVLNPFLNEAIPQKIQNTIPYLMARSLPITLTKRLTRSLTHALVPTLSRSLSSTSKQSHQRYWCDLCYRKALHCNYCHDSPQSQYYTNFYANYYSDYYVNYYEPYYTQALTDLDKKQHPAAEQQGAKEFNNGGKNEANPPDASTRVVTADGGRLTDDGIV